MNVSVAGMDQLLEQVVNLLDIPPSYYQKATHRYRSLGEWLSREESNVVDLDPHVYVQGSFRYGTVIRPLLTSEEYDLDLVCEVALTKNKVSQKQAKHIVGDEIKAYSEAHSFQGPAEEKKRCWRLNYSDEVSFHMDILPSLPEDAACKVSLMEQGVPDHLAKKSVAITDTDHPNYSLIASDWPCSNPGGFADWFEGRMRAVAEARVRQLVLKAAYASVDKVPAWEWKTPLQRAVQILKRHRDVMFRKDLSLRPISMIITSLAGHAYEGETNIFHALSNIIERMPTFILPTKPRIPNPVHPDEDFADRWASDRCLEKNFWNWHTQVKADIGNLAAMLGTSRLTDFTEKRFAVTLPEGLPSPLAVTGLAASIPVRTPTPVVRITDPPRPWRD